MPRLPVDGKKVVEHRITLGTKERQLIESYVFANQINQIHEKIYSIEFINTLDYINNKKKKKKNI